MALMLKLRNKNLITSAFSVGAHGCAPLPTNNLSVYFNPRSLVAPLATFLDQSLLKWAGSVRFLCIVCGLKPFSHRPALVRTTLLVGNLQLFAHQKRFPLSSLDLNSMLWCNF